MNPAEFPPNSKASKQNPEEKRVTRVVTGEVIRKKRGLGRQLRETFIAGDMKASVAYALLDVGMPMVRNAVWEALSEGLYRLINGEGKRRGASPPAYMQPTGTVQYNMMGRPPTVAGPQRAMSRAGRARHNFDEVIIDTRAEAEEVIDRLYSVVSQYGTATVADLYELVGLASTHSDHKWGWTDLRGAGVSHYRDGYLLDLPEPHAL